MFRLGPETSRNICEKEGIKGTNFGAQYAMYFHTQDQGMFFMNLGRIQLSYPFARDFNLMQKRRNTLDLANNLLSSGVVKNVFFNIEENEEVIEDRMLILM